MSWVAEPFYKSSFVPLTGPPSVFYNVHKTLDQARCVFYIIRMSFTVTATDEFKTWLKNLRDGQGRIAIATRIARIEAGLLGNVKSVGDGVSELKIDVGPGYRVYFVTRGRTVVVLLCGGDKGSQRRDIAKAKGLAGGL